MKDGNNKEWTDKGNNGGEKPNIIYIIEKKRLQW
jgi:hypothetical protein